MSILISDWLHTSKDVLRGLMSKHGVPALEILLAPPSAEAVQNVESAPPRVIDPDFNVSGNSSWRLSPSGLRRDNCEHTRNH